MFEEDFERCFICQQPCKGLYCSSECRMQDKGTPSPAIRAAGVRLTSQIPAHLSPLIRPLPHITPSPRMPAHLPAGSSASSSANSSPIQSPRTNPSADVSPQKEAFNLPPPAFPSHQVQIMAFPGSVPVKIPALVPRASPATQASPAPESHGSSMYPTGTSIDTLRFGRKPGVINSVTSPNALLPRCACGKPANHRSRTTSKDRGGLDSGFSALLLGPSLADDRVRSHRIVSDPAHFGNGRTKAASGLATPAEGYHTPSTTLSGSLLARSRSDPMPSSPKDRSVIAPMTSRVPATISPRRLSNDEDGRNSAILPALKRSAATSPTDVEISPLTSPRRGRSRERTRHRDESLSRGRLLQTIEREQAPSRSRHRREEAARRRSDERLPLPLPPIQMTSQMHLQTPLVEPAQIMPSWSKRTSSTDVKLAKGEGVVAPSARRSGGSGSGSGASSPRTAVDDAKGKSEAAITAERGRKAEELQRANAQLGQIFGIA
ncbi:hypothetical protein BCR39DRAFT_323021 [Naematelia encephala]|uniref:Uncharacterized protein n=1 Tax=Naematelia encephala TaxID=71784 RepID=A0A1Y2AP46_9TREE|nr:hypothetical protein BCR39DRAFT_323021 [Naematelia encephala]